MNKFIFSFILTTSLGLPALAEEARTTVYVTDWCGYCRKLEGFLKAQGIDYARHDVEKDSAAMEEFHRLGGEGVPLVTVGEEVIYGYDPERILQALGR